MILRWLATTAGIESTLESLRHCLPPDLSTLSLGDPVLAAHNFDGEGTWSEAELEEIDSSHGLYRVAFVNDGSRAEVSDRAVVPLKYINDINNDSSDNGGIISSDSGSDEEEVVGAPKEDWEAAMEEGEGLGLLSFPEAHAMARAGKQTDTVTFAAWEEHTRGMASKMMAAMGFKRGTGLGSRGQGIVDPIEVRVLPPKRALDFVSNDDRQEGVGGETAGKKRKGRGGERRRKQKLAAAARQAKVDAHEDFAPDLFTFINGQLAKSSQAVEQVGNGNVQSGPEHKPGVTKAAATSAGPKGGGTRKVDRRTLLATADEVKELTTKIEKLEEMAVRNKKDKKVYAAVQRKLGETRLALTQVEGAQANTQHALHVKEQSKKWMRF